MKLVINVTIISASHQNDHDDDQTNEIAIKSKQSTIPLIPESASSNEHFLIVADDDDDDDDDDDYIHNLQKTIMMGIKVLLISSS